MKKSHLLFILLAASVLNINAAEDLEFQEIQSKLRIIRQHNKKIRVTIENLENQEEAASIQIEKCNEILKSIPQEDYNKRLADINEELSIRSELSKAFEGEGEGEGQKQAQHDLIIQSLQSEKIDLLKHLVEAMHKKEEEENQRKIKEVATAKLVEWHALLRRASSVADELEKKAAQYLAKKRQDEEAERAAKAQAAKAKEAEKDPAEVLTSSVDRPKSGYRRPGARRDEPLPSNGLPCAIRGCRGLLARPRSCRLSAGAWGARF